MDAWEEGNGLVSRPATADRLAAYPESSPDCISKCLPIYIYISTQGNENE